MFFSFGQAKGQAFVPATTPDETFPTNVQKVNNTGTDFAYFDNSYFKVTVWDGNNPMIGWDPGSGPKSPISFLGSSIGKIEDPDVVIFPDNTNHVLYLVSIYVIKGNVWIEGLNYSNGNWQTTFSPVQLSSSGKCETPNLDINSQNNLVAVWQDDNDISILFTNSQYQNPNIMILFNGSQIESGQDPDVAVYFDTQYGAAKYTVTFLIYDSYAGATDICASNNPFGSVGTFFNHYRIYNPEYYGKPRIACTRNNNNEYYEIVVGHYDGNNLNEIVGFNQQIINNNTLFSGPTILNTSLTHCYNQNHCVGYASGMFAAVWENESSNTSMKDIIMRKLDIAGNPVNNSYYIVNHFTSDNQIVPSVSGLKTGNHDIVYAFFNEPLEEIDYKHSDIMGNAVRKGLTTTIDNNTTLYPNPANNYLILNKEGEIAKYFIIDTHGKTVLSGILSEKIRKVNIQQLSSGIYFVKFITPNNTDIYKLIIQ